MQYSIYTSLYKTLLFSIPRNKREGITPATFMGLAIKNVPGYMQSLEYPYFVQDQEYIKEPRIFFPDSPELVKRMQKANVKIDEHAFRFDKFPVPFSIAWPKELNIPPCLVSYMTTGEWLEMQAKFAKECGIDAEMPETGRDINEKRFAFMFNEKTSDSGPTGLLHAVYLPMDKVMDCLTATNPQDFAQALGGYEGSDPLSEADLRDQMVVTQNSLRMMVYMSACPDKIVDGMPGSVREKQVRQSAHVRGLGDKPKALTITMPRQSPGTHYRTWHFRRPRKRADGTRRPGLSFVHDTIVNGRKDAETKTVLS